MELKSITLEQFKELVEEFVSENFTADGCRECHEVGHNIVPDDYKGSYNKALNKLFNKLY